MIVHYLLPRDDSVDRFYMTRKEGGRELADTDDYVEAPIQRLKEYTNKSKKRLIKKASNNNNRKTKSSKLKCEEKTLYEYIRWQINEISFEMTWPWL